MKWWFEDYERQVTLLAEINSWLGTPYRHQCGVKGKGTDCIYFVATALHNVGAFKGRIPVIPPYPKDWHLHRGEARLYNGLKRQLDAEEVGMDEMMNGDVVLFQFGRHAAHSSIYFNGDVYQCLTDIGVEKRRWTDEYYLKRARINLRIKA